MHLLDAKLLARRLMDGHGLHGWTFHFDHARRRFGSCQFALRRITLSRPLTLLNDESQVADTLLHEIAHALTPGSGHGPAWKAKCLELGAVPRRCYTDATVRSPARSPAPYRLGCRRCDWWLPRRRRTRRSYLCARCRGRLILEAHSAIERL